MLIPLQKNKGLWLAGATDEAPDGSLRRARGVHRLSSGSLRSRSGSAVIRPYNAHSLYYFTDNWYYGVGTNFHKGAATIKTGLSGDRLSFSRMPPIAGIVDYLFVAGGDALFKVDSGGNVTNWGIDAPATAPSLADGGAATGTIDAGVYTYAITYKNTTTGHRSNGISSAALTVAADTSSVELTAIPTSSDSQVDAREVWRTLTDGTLLFLLDTIADNTTTTYTDDGSVSSTSTELPIDNDEPYSWFDDCLGPYNASMFWITRSQSGNRGRLFYSPIGRAESMLGYIEVTSDDDPLQRIVRWGGMLGVISESRVFQILGTYPYIAREVSGIPGTNKPHSVALTPRGPVYESDEGPRLFNGSTADLLGGDDILRVFQGESVENLTAFSGVVGEYARGSYYVSDGTQTLAYNFLTNRWLDVGVGMNAMHFTKEADILAATVSSTVLDFEKEGELDDNGTDIALSWEPAHVRLHDEKECVVNNVIVDVNTSGETVTVTAITDGTEYNLGSFSAASRKRVSLNLEKPARVAGVRITGSVADAVELFGLYLNVYVPKETQ